ncbi:electron transport complex subunit RsxG [Colwellia sp. D2M02]|uniref:electron transport complex subunit RsxG n=1 Tax=Colwellia sp. D2M02 TaxID=2841562 RepID=UPI001C09C589|nr:electron transport complex subunit RsxG [Colwellia sp. D2M02]MBU2892416.1 electron transport complex subunit RsxG [Colwellia sp. D2M02]
MSNKKTKTVSATTVAVSNNSKILTLFAIACTGLVALVNELTQDKIKAQEQQQLLNTLHAIIEPSRYDNDIANDCISVSSPFLGTNDVKTAYVARKNNKIVALAMTSTAPNGYNGNIDFIVGINIDATISGVRILKHQETPGLGDKIEIAKHDWITKFNGKTLISNDDKRWSVVKDGGMFDQFTGATITPRAVVHGIKNTLSYFKNNQQSLLTQPNTCKLASPSGNIEKTSNVENTSHGNAQNTEVTNEH